MTDLGRRPTDEGEANRDYVWHFKLTPASLEDDGERLTAMVRAQLAALLSCVKLTDDGNDVKVTGFRFLGEPDVEHDIYRASASGVVLCEGD